MGTLKSIFIKKGNLTTIGTCDILSSSAFSFLVVGVYISFLSQLCIYERSLSFTSFDTKGLFVVNEK
ncbi:hypothetical protein H8958_000374 [Nasalis larvatus]|uniref:Uncharacterized protein n=1 Tax=Rhinopithecus roxellana TaxID=61622 RepID=A0A2K6NGB1_RHIRO